MTTVNDAEIEATEPIENWRTIPYYTDYEVSDQGNVRNINKDKILKSHDNGTGYLYVRLSKAGKTRNFYIHRLVAHMFLGPIPDEEEIDHKNCVRSDNRLSNLRLVSRSDNQKNRNSSKGITYEYFDELPDDVIRVDEYNGYEFEGITYSPSTDKFYFDNGAHFRVLHLIKHGVCDRFTAYDITEKKRYINVQKWKRNNL